MLTAVMLALPFEFLLFQIACTYVGLRLLCSHEAAWGGLLHERPPIASNQERSGLDGCKILKCMVWAGTGVLWTIEGGVPKSLGLVGEALAKHLVKEVSGPTFLQISDSHIGFDKPANPNAIGTLEEAIGKIGALPAMPSFMIHTGDISHLSKPQGFDDTDKIIAQAKLDVHHVPGEHDLLDEEAKLYREREADLKLI